jgi:hypothetical protein
VFNRRPIFVNGFSRGGTTILMNVLASHPDVCTVEEVHHLFKGHNLADSALRILLKCVLHDAPAIALIGQDFFSPRLIHPRKRLSPTARRFVDRVLYSEKLRMRGSCFNRFKRENVEYTLREIADARLLGKNLDGLIYASDAFAEMYPDATFFGLVRDGLALCESHLRRNRPAAELGFRYRVLGQKMMADRQRMPRYMLLRFEELLSEPIFCIRHIFGHAGLDQPQLRNFRMQVRRVMDADGNHRLAGGNEWEVVWLDVRELDSYFRKDVNQNQIKRLSAADRDAFLREAGDTMEALGYSTSRRDRERHGYGSSSAAGLGVRKAA